ncbi:MAG: hypothetical protein AMXMBFR45_26350 [Gammaproteobacteria bacterium]|nr:MAG: hypothetical protein EDM71_07995 [Pseudomonadota bacterium]MBC6945145.1 hypothetical protein [Gammaproteobacteria bacterium]MCE7897048.1 hypothetical protein [Gammaproteobacteria bacterium PRO8]MCQ3934732.1 hypothetical protein [Gammaproteobacteria bacterium]
MARGREGYATVLTWDLWDGWEKEVEPDDRAFGQFCFGLETLCGGEEAMARAYFARALEVCERGEREKPWSESPHYGFPLNRARLRRVRAHCLGLLTGPPATEALKADLRAASVDYQTWCAGLTASEWDPQGQAYYLAAVRLAQLVNETERARELLKSRRSLRYHTEERALLVAMASGATDSSFHVQYASFFDRIREPMYKPPFFFELHLVRLELALLYDSFCGDGPALDWRSAALKTAA